MKTLSPPTANSEKQIRTIAFNLGVKKRSDKIINYFLVSFFLAGLIFAFFFDTWLIALGVGSLSLMAYYSIKYLLPDSDLYQYVLSAVLGIFMAQFIYQMHGLFEMHFFAFIASAILITYQKWKLQIPLTILVVVHHGVFGYLQNIGYDQIYFTRLDYFELQTFIIHVLLAAAIFFICGLWAYQLEKYGEIYISQNVEVGRLQKEEALFEERKRSEEALKIAYTQAENARREADDANKAKSIFLATMSHEIRTPMNGVIGMASLLTETSLNDEQREYTNTIRNCGESLLSVINDILDFSKIDSGKMELENKDFELRECIEEVLDLFGSKAAQSGLDLIYQLGHNVPAQIVGDSLRLKQILINLVSNAIKFTKKGEIFVVVSLLHSDGEQCELKFEIRDTGIGIPQDKIDRLFKAFSQVDSSTTRKYGGTGLGLVISEKLVALMGGSIKVESIEGLGTTFSFTIHASVSTESIQTYVTCNLAGIEGKRVLVVDDNSTNLNIFKGQLEQWKIVPTLAYSGQQALEILSTNIFDLVLSDMQMPEMDGVELTQSIRKLHPTLPVILLSSVGDEQAKIHRELFASILTKPVKQNLLFKHILNEFRKKDRVSLELPTDKSKLSFDFSQRFPMRILIAEDNLVNQRLAERVLNKLGYQPELATNGYEALEAIIQKQHDMVLMDVQMPEMDGLEATRQIRLLEGEQPVIIAMTANAMQGDREDCLKAGMNDYISKPIKLEVLVDLLEKWAIEIKNKHVSV